MTKATRGPGSPWTLTSPNVILTWRARHGLSEKAAAQVLGVSATTLRNWTRYGKTAMTRTQRRVHKAMAAYDEGIAAKAASKTPPKAAAPPPPAPTSTAVSEIVLTYVRQGGEIRGDLIDYISRVRLALEC